MVKKFIRFIALVMAIVIMPMGVNATSLDNKCSKSCPTSEGKCTSTCTISVKDNNATMTTFQANLVVVGEGATITSFTPGDGWTKVSPTDSDLANSTIPINFVSTDGVTESNFTLATITLELESSAADCSLRLTNPSVGNEVTVTIETTTETKTGAALPIAIIGCGVIGAGVIYSVTKKNKKIYKI